MLEADEEVMVIVPGSRKQGVKANTPPSSDLQGYNFRIFQPST